MNKGFGRGIFLVFFVLGCLDALSTFWILQLPGGGEGNPAMRWILVHCGMVVFLSIRVAFGYYLGRFFQYLVTKENVIFKTAPYYFVAVMAFGICFEAIVDMQNFALLMFT